MRITSSSRYFPNLKITKNKQTMKHLSKRSVLLFLEATNGIEPLDRKCLCPHVEHSSRFIIKKRSESFFLDIARSVLLVFEVDCYENGRGRLKVILRLRVTNPYSEFTTTKQYVILFLENPQVLPLFIF